MFEIKNARDRRGVEYTYVRGDDNREPKKVYLILPVWNDHYYLDYCLKSFQNQVDGIFAVDNMSTDGTEKILKDFNVNYFRTNEKDQSKKLNRLLKRVPKDGWCFYVDSDQVLYDLPDKYLGRYASYLESQKIYCSDSRNIEICYNYGTMLAIDWGDGPGILWTARRLFKYTGKEYFVKPQHFNICNVPKKDFGNKIVFNNEHTGEWLGVVAKNHAVKLYHYGKCSGIEKMRGKNRKIGLKPVLDREMMIMGHMPTMPFRGMHPSVMGLKYFGGYFDY